MRPKINKRSTSATGARPVKAPRNAAGLRLPSRHEVLNRKFTTDECPRARRFDLRASFFQLFLRNGSSTTLASRIAPSAGILSLVPTAKYGRFSIASPIAALDRTGETVLLVTTPIV